MLSDGELQFEGETSKHPADLRISTAAVKLVKTNHKKGLNLASRHSN